MAKKKTEKKTKTLEVIVNKQYPGAEATVVYESRSVLRRGGREKTIEQVPKEVWKIDLTIDKLIEILEQEKGVLITKGDQGEFSLTGFYFEE